MKHLQKVALALIVCVGSGSAGRQVAFIGLSGEGAPAVEKTFDRLLREQLSVMPEAQVVDYIESQRFQQKVNFLNYPTVSRDLVNSLARFAPDSTLFVWGIVKTYRIRPVRRFLFGAAIRADLVIGLSMYSLANRTFAYAGDVDVSATKSKGVVLFDRVDKVVHISALDRTDLLEKLEAEAVKESARMIGAVVRSENEKDKELEKSEAQRYRVPSLSDVFDVPYVEPPSVDTSATKTPGDTTAAAKDTAKPDSAAGASGPTAAPK